MGARAGAPARFPSSLVIGHWSLIGHWGLVIRHSPAMHHYRPKQDPSSSHGQITRLVRQLGRAPVLDVGAAQGMLGQMLADANLPIDALEPNSAWAEAARPYYRNVFNSAIETTNGLPERYAVVICGDVLEHTADPVAALRKLMGYATEDAAFVV